ncbi:low affinity immunoglobulin gamma Fc region receptor III-A-like [Leptodactylus fuscus]
MAFSPPLYKSCAIRGWFSYKKLSLAGKNPPWHLMTGDNDTFLQIYASCFSVEVTLPLATGTLSGQSSSDAKVRNSIAKSTTELWPCFKRAAIRPAVTFTPDYKKIFTSEQITMTCDVGSTIGEGMDYICYRDSKQVYNGKSYIIQKAETSHSGSYQCQTRPGEISDPARLEVSDRYDVILQTPLYVYEGDDIYIRCRHRPGNSGGRTRFDKDRINITDWSDNAEYYISNVTKMTAGTYRCIKEVYYNDIYNLHVDEVSVSVQDFTLCNIEDKYTTS